MSSNETLASAWVWGDNPRDDKAAALSASADHRTRPFSWGCPAEGRSNSAHGLHRCRYRHAVVIHLRDLRAAQSKTLNCPVVSVADAAPRDPQQQWAGRCNRVWQELMRQSQSAGGRRPTRACGAFVPGRWTESGGLGETLPAAGLLLCTDNRCARKKAERLSRFQKLKCSRFCSCPAHPRTPNFHNPSQVRYPGWNRTL